VVSVTGAKASLAFVGWTAEFLISCFFTFSEVYIDKRNELKFKYSKSGVF
jgi:hypothetical protein